MYGFVKEKSENTHISSCEVLEIENKYNINFPTMLKVVLCQDLVQVKMRNFFPF